MVKAFRIYAHRYASGYGDNFGIGRRFVEVGAVGQMCYEGVIVGRCLGRFFVFTLPWDFWGLFNG